MRGYISGLGDSTIAENAVSDAAVDMEAFAALAAALVAERERSRVIAETIEVMQTYSTRTMHQAATDKMHIRQLQADIDNYKVTVAALRKSVDELSAELVLLRPLRSIIQTLADGNHAQQ